MLVVADQRAAGIGRKRRLAGARKAEEHGGLAIGSDIGRTVHRHHALGRKQEVQDPEHALLHLAGIAGAADQDQLLGEAYRDHRLSAAAVALGVCNEARQVDDCIFRDELVEIAGSRAHQHGVDEQRMPGEFGDYADVDPVVFLRPAEQVGDIELFLGAKRGQKISLERVEMLRTHRLVDVAPPDGVLGHSIPHDVLVLRAAPGELAGLDH